MKRFASRLTAGLSALTASVTVIALTAAAPASAATGQSSAAGNASTTADCPWLSQQLPVQQRVSMLLAKMTLGDKISMVTGQPGTSPAGAIGGTPAIPVLCIPALSEEDGPIGVGDGLTGVTQLPAAVSLSSAWSPSLAQSYGTVLGAEEYGKGMEVDYGPTINIQRDPRWGRNFEAFTEDPYLDGQVAAGEIHGIQSQDVIAEVKHLGVYNQETYRNTPQDNAIVSSRAIHEIYLPGFYSAVAKGGAGAVMCSYSTVNGQYACQDGSLLNIAEQRWDWPGFVSSDYGATHSTVTSATAGLDQEMPSGVYYGSTLEAAVRDGQVSMSTLNGMVSRILTEMFRFGFFNHQPSGNSKTVVTSPAHSSVAQSVAEQGTVLLRNSGGILPLGSSVKSVAVIGADGTTSPMSAGGGSAHVNAAHVISPLTGIQAAAPAGTTVTSYSGTDPAQAATAAKAAQVAVVFASNFESEGSDLSSITLQNNQDAYIEAVAAANPDTIVVLNTGGPVAMPWVNQVKGVLEAWYPGQQDGAAIAAVLFGTVDPSGHLPETFPQSLSQVPASTTAQWPGVNGKVQYSEGLDVGYRWYNAKNIAPLFPFGYGLSYTTFRFSDLKVTPGSVDNTVSGPQATDCHCNGQGIGQVQVSATVTNTGTRTGSEVAQLYLGDPAAAGEPPRQLKGFRKVTLKPGQSTTVQFRLTGHDLSYWDNAANGWVEPDGKYALYVGDSSALANLPLRGNFTVAKTIGARYAALSAPGTRAPESSFTVNATFVNHGDYPIIGARPSLRTPAGWQASRVGPVPGDIRPGQTVTVPYRVTVPEAAQNSSATLTARLTYQQPPGPGFRELSPSRPGGRTEILASSVVQVEPLAAGKLSVPAALIQPGKSVADTLSLTSNAPATIAVDYQAAPPSGISVSPASGSAMVPAGGAMVPLTVSVAAGTPGGEYSVPISLTAADHGQTFPLTTVTLTVSVPFASVPAAYNDIGITTDANTAVGAFDGANNSYSEQALTASALAPGASVYQDGTTLTWPDVAAGQPDNIITKGQTIDMSGQGSSLVLLGASNNGTGSGPLTMTYTDGTSETTTINFADWYVDAPAAGDGMVTTTQHWNQASGPGTQPVSVYSTSVPLDPSKTLESVTLPDINPGVPGDGELTAHIFAMGVSRGSASVAYPSLSSAYNNVGIADSGQPAQANYDGGGYSFAQQALTAAGLAPGASVSQDGVTATWPAASAGQLDNVVAEGQTIDLKGTGSTLLIAGAANNGTATGTGTITYADGSTQSFTISLADWYANAPASGDQLLATTADWNYPSSSTLGNHQVSVYSTAVALDAGKTVTSVTLPAVSHGVGDSMNAMHIFSMAIGG